jgi:sugar O-acyltransferase (sialic acid O-acetyltransferase NeuD family)
MDSYIFGSGGSAKDVSQICEDADIKIAAFVGQTQGSIDDLEVLEEAQFFPGGKFDAYIAVGSAKARKKIFQNITSRFGSNVNFPVLVHPSSRIMGLKNGKVRLGRGSTVGANCTMTHTIIVGDFAQLNNHTSIAHDCICGDWLTTAPGARINGNVRVGDFVFFGSNSCTKENITIASDVVIGAGAVVVKDIYENGVYVGVPATKMT